MKHYVKENMYGTNLSRDSIGWDILVFNSKQERADYLNDNEYHNCNLVAEKCTRNEAQYIFGHNLSHNRTVSIDAGTQYNCEVLAWI